MDSLRIYNVIYGEMDVLRVKENKLFLGLWHWLKLSLCIITKGKSIHNIYLYKYQVNNNS